MIVATAGHVDHGKTLLVKALTGIDTDRLEEEKRRGLTIDLGFAYHDFDGERVGFIDVPGHHRFIHNMLAGVSGIDYAMLVVAADDGIMPQTLEHLAILRLLKIPEGICVITKADRVDAKRLDEVERALREITRDTFLESGDVFRVSSVRGSGVDTLGAHLASAARRCAGHTSERCFRLSIDRAFTLRGAGVVVTGTVHSGRVGIGDELVSTPNDIPVRVRGLHVQDLEATHSQAGDRCALNLAGIERTDLGRGDWLVAQDAIESVDRIDVSLSLLASQHRPLRHWTPVHIHLAASHFTGRVALLEPGAIEPGETRLAQLVLDGSVPARRLDRFIVRDQAQDVTLGGGEVLDIHPPRRGRRRPERIRYLECNSAKTPSAALTGLIDAFPNGIDLDRFESCWNLTREERDVLEKDVPCQLYNDEGHRFAVSDASMNALQKQLVVKVSAWHKASPHVMGIRLAQLRPLVGAGPTDALITSALAGLVRKGTLSQHGAMFAAPDHRPELVGEDRRLWQRIEPMLDVPDLKPPILRELSQTLGVPLKMLTDFLKRTSHLGFTVGVADNRYFLPGTVRTLASYVEDLAARDAEGHVTAKAFRDRSGIGRNLAIDVLEFFDAQGFTRRHGDWRIVLKPADEVFGAAH
jgi:selenocysteine-specific elongation factor